MSVQKSFYSYIESTKQKQQLVVQPRMGVSDLKKMGQGLRAVSNLPFPVVATITIDSFTRNLELQELNQVLKEGHELNGFPLITYGSEALQEMIKIYTRPDLLVQVRHGSPLPLTLFKVMAEGGIYHSEGGPLSYCLPYSRVPIEQTIENWKKSLLFLSQYPLAHMESFGGCMLGQLCHPSLLIAVAVLEGMFFEQCGIRDISLSYAQGTHTMQDLAALRVLGECAQQYLDGCRVHRVLYTYMGMYPVTPAGARALLKESVRLAKLGGVERLVVKTEVESIRIPTFDENINALITAHRTSESKEMLGGVVFDEDEYDRIKLQAHSIIRAVLSLDRCVGKALEMALHSGMIDIPYCLHPQNKNNARCGIDARGYLQWISPGNIPLDTKTISPYFGRGFKLSPDGFINMLSYMQKKFDGDMCKT